MQAYDPDDTFYAAVALAVDGTVVSNDHTIEKQRLVPHIRTSEHSTSNMGVERSYNRSGRITPSLMIRRNIENRTADPVHPIENTIRYRAYFDKNLPCVMETTVTGKGFAGTRRSDTVNESSTDTDGGNSATPIERADEGRTSRRRFLSAATRAGVGTFALGAVSVGSALQPPSRESAPLAAVYRGPASCGGCSAAVADLIRRSPHEFRVQYIGPDEKRKPTTKGLRGVALYAQPGGDGSVGRAEIALGETATSAIPNYVADGGRYVGFCMGAYLAGSDPGMGLLAPGDTGGYIDTAGASVKSARDAVIPVKWRGTHRYQFAQDPPYIVPSGVAGEEVLSRFTNGRVNALVRPYGRGSVGVVGTHPEADRGWYTRKLWREDEDGPDTSQGLDLVERTMRSGFDR